MRELFAHLVDELIGRFGFCPRLVPLDDVHPVDVREATGDPRSFLYALRFQPVLIDAPVSRGVNPTGIEEGPTLWTQRVSGGEFARMSHSTGDDPIDAIALVRTEGDWVWLPTSEGGRRRAGVLCAAGREMVSIRLLRVVYREDVRLWPSVAAGEIGPDEALREFDRLFEQGDRTISRGRVE